jgi:hypothetical protein
VRQCALRVCVAWTASYLALQLVDDLPHVKDVVLHPTKIAWCSRTKPLTHPATTAYARFSALRPDAAAATHADAAAAAAANPAAAAAAAHGHGIRSSASSARYAWGWTGRAARDADAAAAAGDGTDGAARGSSGDAWPGSHGYGRARFTQHVSRIVLRPERVFLHMMGGHHCALDLVSLSDGMI